MRVTCRQCLTAIEAPDLDRLMLQALIHLMKEHMEQFEPVSTIMTTAGEALASAFLDGGVEFADTLTRVRDSVCQRIRDFTAELQAPTPKPAKRPFFFRR